MQIQVRFTGSLYTTQARLCGPRTVNTYKGMWVESKGIMGVERAVDPVKHEAVRITKRVSHL